MKLKKLLKDLKGLTVKGSKDLSITGLSANSKIIYPGNLFIVKKGAAFDGHDFVPEAVQTGASAILTDLYDPTLKQITQIIHPHPEDLEGELAARYYQQPSDALYMVGVTGTNGKTTCAYLLRHLFEKLGEPCGLMGTIEYLTGTHRYEANRTTPDLLTTHKLLREMSNAGCKAAVMEVTSHGLTQGRVSKVHFDAAVFTNLTQDHLDYHRDMEAYCDAKRMLFEQLAASSKPDTIAVVNVDDPWCSRLLNGLKLRRIGYGASEAAELRASNIELSAAGTCFNLEYKDKSLPVQWSLIGGFNVYNFLAAVGVGLARGWDIEHIVNALQSFDSVPGRLERVPNQHNLHVFVDYSHTPDALRNVLDALRNVSEQRVIAVFGCGGDRDKGKRPKMAEVAEQLSDTVIVTSDNPRTEDPASICRDIMAGFQRPNAVAVELDRREAIRLAIAEAKPGDSILIAGKGHETYQQFARETLPFDDREVAREALESLVLQ